LRRFLVGFVQIRPIRVQLVAPMLRDEDMVLRIDGKAFGIAYAGREALGR